MEVMIRQIQPGDAVALADFYNALQPGSKRTFHPLGELTSTARCAEILEANLEEPPVKCDLVAVDEGRIVGWSFLWNLDQEEPTFGLGVADAYQNRGLGSRLMDRVLETARERGHSQIKLTVVQDNHRAQRMYERRGFVFREAFLGEDGLPYHAMSADLRAAKPAQAH